MRASRRILHTDTNQGRKFFRCPRYISKVEPGCGFFVWYDVKVAAVAEKQHLVRLLDFLQKWVGELEYENKDLQKRLGELADVGRSETNVATELYMLTKRVSHLKISSGLECTLKE
ncbi:hypothetical protein LINPERHAP1_LOCUS7904 [Linum perenne]